MPYTKKQCNAFGAKANRNQRVPSDWKRHCKKKAQKKRKR